MPLVYALILTGQGLEVGREVINAMGVSIESMAIEMVCTWFNRGRDHQHQCCFARSDVFQSERILLTLHFVSRMSAARGSETKKQGADPVLWQYSR